MLHAYKNKHINLVRLKQLQILGTIVEAKDLKAVLFWLVAQLMVEAFVEEEKNNEEKIKQR